MNLILIGAQGSGKGTQAQRLAERYHLASCASGELLRQAIAQGTPLGRAAKPYLERGDLVPDELVIGLVLECMHGCRDCNGVILDGFPRNVAQARALDEQLGARSERIDRVIYLDVPREMLLERLSGRYVCRAQEHVWNVKTNPPRVLGICDYDGSELYQRSDDTPEKIARRLEAFFTETIKLTDYYRAQGKLLHIDGSAEIDTVTQTIVEGLRDRPFGRAAG